MNDTTLERLIGRRAWLKLAPALTAVLAAQQPASPPAAPPAPRFSRETLREALRIAGLDFPDAQLDMMLPAVGRSLEAYTRVRAVPVPLDTEPAISFHPLPPKTPPVNRFVLSKLPAPRRAGSIDDLAFHPALELGRMIHAKQVTSFDLTRMYLARLKKYGPKLNCVVTLTEAPALEQAATADKAHDRKSPLHGVPWGAKDLFATKGIPTTWGAEPYRNQVIDYDATVVERLRAAHAPLLAKLSMGALAQGGLWFGGMTRNPWKTDETSSGSSAGSAAATAAGLVGFALGTETLGSIVSPCSRCGAAGVRPTYGRVSRYGAMGLSWTMDKIGPIARSVEDCAAILRAIYGPDGHDATVRDIPLQFDARADIRKLRIGVVQADFDAIQKAEDKTVYEKALADLRAAGAGLQPVVFPDYKAGDLLTILDAEAATAFDDLTRNGGIDQLSGQAPSDWPNQFRTARVIPAIEYLRAQRARTILQHELDRFLEDWDVLVSPNNSPTLIATNLTGHPQVVVPCGLAEGRPRSLLFTGHLYHEGTPIRVALAYERATDWHRQQPPEFKIA